MKDICKICQTYHTCTRGCIECFINTGFNVMDSYRYIYIWGWGNLSLTPYDCYNFITLLKKSKIEVEEDQVVNYFKAKHEQDPLFYWVVKLDEPGRIDNLFFFFFEKWKF